MSARAMPPERVTSAGIGDTTTEMDAWLSSGRASPPDDEISASLVTRPAASALTDNSVVAAILTLSISLVLMLLGLIDDPGSTDLLSRALAVPAVWNQAGRLWDGLVQLSDLVGLLGLTTFFLAFAAQRVDAATWR